jgi:hypothetical protein
MEQPTGQGRPRLTSEDLAAAAAKATAGLGAMPSRDLSPQQRGQLLTSFGLRMLGANNHTGPRTNFLSSISQAGLPTLEEFAGLKKGNEQEQRQYMQDQQALGSNARRQAIEGFNLDNVPYKEDQAARNQRIANLLKMAQAEAIGGWRGSLAGRYQAQTDALKGGRTITGGLPGGAPKKAAAAAGPKAPKALTLNDVEKQINSDAKSLLKTIDANSMTDPRYRGLNTAQKWALANKNAREQFIKNRGQVRQDPVTKKHVVIIDNNPSLAFTID